MELVRKGFLLVLFIALSTSFVHSQDNRNDGNIADPTNPNVFFAVSVKSSREGYLRDLTYKDFEVYSKYQKHEIIYFTFDKSENRYLIGFFQESFAETDKKQNMKIKVRFSGETKKYGRILISSKYQYYPE